MAMGNSSSQLNQAKRNKKDEFYTQLTDIEAEVKYYRQHFKGKVVLCNCDDPRSSMFFRFFADNFEFLGLKRLIATCYKSQDVDLFTQKKCEKAVYQIYEGDKNKSHHVDPDEIDVKQLKGDGSFDSDECIDLLKQSDIVVTNPPFSRFREFIALLIKYDKKFLIIGNVNALTYKEVFPLIMQGRLWLGASIHSGDREFAVPDDYPLEATGCRVDGNGKKYIRVKGVRWYTNLDYKERHQNIPLFKKYTPVEYPTYDNYDAINVSKTSEIPSDYFGVIGVPITFMDKFNPDQFEIIGATESEGKGFSLGLWDPSSGVAQPLVKGAKVYKRIFIRRRKKD